MSQCQRILNYMKQGKSLTPTQALSRFGCFRLAARIADLKESGHTITTEMVKRDGKRFAKYRLVA